MNKILKLFIACLLLTSCSLGESILTNDTDNTNVQKNIDILTQDIDETTQENDVLKPSIYNKEEKSIKIDEITPIILEETNNKTTTKTQPTPQNDSKTTTDKYDIKQDMPKNKGDDKITYGDIEYIDEVIAYKHLEDKKDSTKDKGTSGILTKGQDGFKRKEVRKVYVNGKYSHTETIKNTYTVKEPINAQNWVGTKEQPLKPKDTLIIDNKTWHLYKTFSSDTACIANIQSLQDQHFREWEGGSMCWGEHLYYSTGD